MYAEAQYPKLPRNTDSFPDSDAFVMFCRYSTKFTNNADREWLTGWLHVHFVANDFFSPSVALLCVSAVCASVTSVYASVTLFR